MFFILKKFDNDKKPIFKKDFLCQIKILLLNIKKLIKIPGFLFKTPGFSMFKKNLKFQVFQGFQVKKTTLIIFET